MHRDLKPENILLANPEDDTVLKVSDFGLAKMAYDRAEPTSSEICGSDYYLAPELVKQVKEATLGTSEDENYTRDE